MGFWEVVLILSGIWASERVITTWIGARGASKDTVKRLEDRLDETDGRVNTLEAIVVPESRLASEIDDLGKLESKKRRDLMQRMHRPEKP